MRTLPEMATREAARAAKSASGSIAVSKVGSHQQNIERCSQVGSTDGRQKYTVQSTGIWERIRRLLAIDPSRSTGVPLNPQFRNPPPGALDPTAYDDPTTIPAADIAENPYWKRDVRRSYPRLSTVSQGDVVGLLTVGSKAAPNEQVPLVGEAGTKQLVQVKQQAEEKGLASFFEKDKKNVAGVLGSNGLPPLPRGLSAVSGGRKQYERTAENAYPEE